MNKLVACLALISVLLISNVYAEVIDNSKIGLKDLHFEYTPNGLRKIKGKATNKTNQTFSLVTIKFNLLKEGKVIAHSTETLHNLGAGQSTEIDGFYNSIASKPDSIEVADIDAH